MEGFSLAIATTSVGAGAGANSSLYGNATTRLPSILHGRRTTSVSFRRKHKFLVFASNEELDFSEWEKMEIKVGKMIDEDPRLTLAKIKAKRLDPGANLLELEKFFYKNKGRLPNFKTISLEWERPSIEPVKRQVVTSLDGMDLVRPVPKKGVKFESSNKPDALETRKPNLEIRKPVVDEKRSTVSNVILRKPTTSKVEGVEEKPLELSSKPNLSMDISNAKTDAMLLRKPEPTGVNIYDYKNRELSGGATDKVVDDMKLKMSVNENVDESDKMLLRKPKHIDKELSSSAEDLVNMVKEEKEVKQSDILLSKKPEGVQELSSSAEDLVKMVKEETEVKQSDIMLSKKPEAVQELSCSADDLVNMVKEEKEMKQSDILLSKKPEAVQELSSSAEDLVKMVKEETEVKQSDITLSKKPEAVQELSSSAEDLVKMVKEETEVKQSDIMLSKKPEAVQGLSSSAEDLVKMVKEETEVKQSDITLSKKPEVLERKYVKSGIPEIQVDIDAKQNDPSGISESSGEDGAKKDDFGNLVGALDALLMEQEKKDNDSYMGLKQFEHSDVGSTEEEVAPIEQSSTSSVNSDSDAKFSVEAALQGKPKRIDQPVRETSKSARAYTEVGGDVGVELENSNVASPSEELKDTYWARAEELFETRKLEEVKLIRSGSGGYVVSFGPLLGFLPYSNLTGRWKFIAFETWLRSNSLDPSLYGENVGVTQSYDIAETNLSPEVGQKTEGGISPDMQLEDLLKIYEQKKSKFLSSLVGQKLYACVQLADRKSQKLIFSMKAKKDDDLVEKKNVMAKLRIGDVVKCRITRIAYFGVFVEVEGVTALIHQSEVSWDATLDPASYFKIGQILEAKVHQLNFETQRIFLSLRELTSDPLSATLESVIGDSNPFDGRLQAAEADTEWDDVESLIKELQQIEGVQSATKGQFFLSPGLAPTFQVYMASMFEDEYKLLARAGNKVQEVIVRASLDKEEMKAVILTCTNRVG